MLFSSAQQFIKWATILGNVIFSVVEVKRSFEYATIDKF